MSLPNGKQVIGIIFTFAMASGMPMIVTACAMAVVMWVAAIQRPATTNQIRFAIAEPVPAPRLITTVRPNGQSA